MAGLPPILNSHNWGQNPGTVRFPSGGPFRVGTAGQGAASAPGGGGTGGGLQFVVGASTALAVAGIRNYTRALLQAAAARKQLIAQDLIAQRQAHVAQRRLGTSRQNALSRRLFGVEGVINWGAEGVRVGHVRLSRSGFSLSEKTFLGTGRLATAAIAGQIAGHALQTGEKVYERIKQGEDVSRALAEGAVGLGAGLARNVFELFGGGLLAPFMLAGLAPATGGKHSPFASITPSEGRRWINEFWARLSGSSENVGPIYQSVLMEDMRGQRRDMIEAHEKMYADFLGNAGTAPQQAERTRRELGRKFSEQRAMTRSLTGRPLWKIVDYAPGDAIP